MFLSEKKPEEYKISQVVSIISHQLKTPLSAIKGYLEVLISEDVGGLNQKQKEYLKSALKNTQKMVELAADFLDISQIEESGIRLKPELFSLETIVKAAAEEYYFLAKAKNCNLVFEIEEKLPLLYIDILKIKQAVSNMMGNAIAYNVKKGKVIISAAKKGDEVLFCCKDTGIGILEEEREKIFTKFYRSEEAIILSPTGSGLGLFISKAIIEESGGRIWFESEYGKGSVFCFSLPIPKK